MTKVFFAKQTSAASPTTRGAFVYFNSLWEADGNAADNIEIAQVSQTNSPDDDINLLGAYNSEALFTPTTDSNLWISDGTTAGTGILKLLRQGSSDPSGVTNLNGKIVFAASGPSSFDLWASDGTAAGTTSLKTLFGLGITSISDVTVVNGEMYFIANFQGADALGHPNGTYNAALWKSDGTASGTVELAFLSSSENKHSHVGSVSGFSTEILYWLDASTFGNAPQLWETNGTSRTELMAFASGATRSGSDFTQVGNYAYFTIDDGTHGAELWKTRNVSVSSSGEAQTTLVADIVPGSTGSNPTNLTASNGTLYFTVNDGVHGSELWKSNGTSGSTSMVQDIRTGSVGSTPTDLTDVNGKLFFSADDGVHGRELWEATSGGATLVTDIPGSSNPVNLTDVNGLLYFEANDSTGKFGLFRSDGTTAGTVEVATGVDPSAGISFVELGRPITGTVGDNVLVGTTGAEFIDGSYGNDSLYGLSGDDTMVGGPGNDLVIAGGGNDDAYAGDGRDSMFGGDGNDVLVGGVGHDLLEGDDGNDYLYVYNGGGNLYGGNGNDVEVGNLNFDILIGDAGDDVQYGYGGNDYLYGGDGNDVMFGGDGVDVLLGGAGNDYFDGGTGVNYYFGGGGNDTFVANNVPGVQVVQDWNSATDTVQLSGSGFSSFADVLAHSSQAGAYFIVSVDGDTAVWLNGATAGTVTAANFSIVS